MKPAADDDPSSEASRQVEEFVASRINFERIPAQRYDLQDFKLDRMRHLLGELGDPQQSLDAIHIAGTKGKGSTAVMTASILQAAGFRVGLFTSPHLDSIGERMMVDGVIPSGDVLLEIAGVVRPVVERMDRRGPAMRATFFEVLTAMAWIHFAGEHVDFVVLEVGLGGRLDATNVCKPVVSIITSISHDHQRLLGNTLAEIAAEKAGIITPSIPVLSGVVDPEPRDVIRRICQERQAPLYELNSEIRFHETANETSLRHVGREIEGSEADVITPWRSHANLKIPLAGRHQLANASLAVAAVDFLSNCGTLVPESAVHAGLAAVEWPLRIEVLRRQPMTIVDAAHNDGSVEALIDVLKGVPASRRWLIFATSRDKDAPGMLRQLGPWFEQVVLTRYTGNPRALPLSDLETIATECLSVPFAQADNPEAAWRLVVSQSRPDDLICVTGSFFLAAEMRRVIRSDVNLDAEVPQASLSDRGAFPFATEFPATSHSSRRIDHGSVEL